MSKHPTGLCDWCGGGETLEHVIMHCVGERTVITFTFMHLAYAFIQSDLQCIQAIHLYCQY